LGRVVNEYKKTHIRKRAFIDALIFLLNSITKRASE